jgi:DNA-binding transcriptional MerR regulator
MRISQLAAIAGVTTKAIRYYEQLGFVKAERTSSGYRDFDEGTLKVIRTLRQTQRLGVKLSEMEEILALVRSGEQPCKNVRAVIAAKRREVADRIRSLEEFDGFLAELERSREEGDAPCPILSGVKSA